MAQDDPAIDAVLAYHRRTKHHLHRYAASPGSLDWATQPDPFRTFGGADRVALPLLADRIPTAYPALYCPGAVPPLPLDPTSLAMLLELALKLSAGKQFADHRWALRCNPSSQAVWIVTSNKTDTVISPKTPATHRYCRNTSF